MTTLKTALTGVAAIVATVGIAACSVPAQASPEPAPRSPGFGPAFYGVNWDYPSAAIFAHANVDPLLAQLDPSTLRWPGGTDADYFVWQTGKPTQHGQAGFAFTPTDLDNAYRATGATPMSTSTSWPIRRTPPTSSPC